MGRKLWIIVDTTLELEEMKFADIDDAARELALILTRRDNVTPGGGGGMRWKTQVVNIYMERYKAWPYALGYVLTVTPAELLAAAMRISVYKDLPQEEPILKLDDFEIYYAEE